MAVAKSHTRQHVVRIAASLAAELGKRYVTIKGMTFRQVLCMVEAMGYPAPWIVYTECDLNVILWEGETTDKGVSMARKKPRGWGRFDALMKKIIAVPKEQVDEQIAREQAERRARRDKG
jgi:hypothetical protein